MGLREALEQIKALTEIPFAHTAGDHELIYQIATEALAQQPAAVAELTDEELMDIARPTCGNFRWPSTALDIMRQAIAAHIAKQGGA